MDARQATALVLVVPPAEGDVAVPVAAHAVEGPRDDGTDSRSGNDTERGSDASTSAIFGDVDGADDDTVDSDADDGSDDKGGLEA